MADHGDLVAVGRGAHARRETRRSGRRGWASSRSTPPHQTSLEPGEVEVRPLAGELRGRAALVAGEGAALAHHGVDGDRQAELGGEDRGRLQGPPVGAGDQPAQPARRAAARPRRRACSTPRAVSGGSGRPTSMRLAPKCSFQADSAWRISSVTRALGRPGGRRRPDGLGVRRRWLAPAAAATGGRRAGLVDKHARREASTSPRGRRPPPAAPRLFLRLADYMRRGIQRAWRDRIPGRQPRPSASRRPVIQRNVRRIRLSRHPLLRDGRRVHRLSPAQRAGAQDRATSGRGSTRSASAPPAAATTMSCRCPSAAPAPPGRRGRAHPWPTARRPPASPPSGAPIPRFDPDQFLQGARAAFAMIVEAYAKGDKAALRPLLADEVFAQFAGAIDAREQAGRTLSTELVATRAAELVDAGMVGQPGAGDGAVHQRADQPHPRHRRRRRRGRSAPDRHRRSICGPSSATRARATRTGSWSRRVRRPDASRRAPRGVGLRSRALILLGACAEEKKPAEAPAGRQLTLSAVELRRSAGLGRGRSAARRCAAFRRSCGRWAKQAADKRRGRPGRLRRHGRRLARRPAPRRRQRPGRRAHFFETSFAAVRGQRQRRSRGPVHRLLRAAAARRARARRRATAIRSTAARPIWSASTSASSIPSSRAAASAAASRTGRLVPYADRAAIDRGALAGRELELLWVDDPVDRFFLEIQGSGQVRLPTAGPCASATPTRTAAPIARSARI